MGVVRKFKQLGRVKANIQDRFMEKLLNTMWNKIARVENPHALKKAREDFMNVLPGQMAKAVVNKSAEERQEEIDKAIKEMMGSEGFGKFCHKLNIKEGDIEEGIKQALSQKEVGD